jgi:hypothetical protein
MWKNNKLPSLRALVLLGILTEQEDNKFSPSACLSAAPIAFGEGNSARIAVIRAFEELCDLGFLAQTAKGTSRHNQAEFAVTNLGIEFVQEFGILEFTVTRRYSKTVQKPDFTVTRRYSKNDENPVLLQQDVTVKPEVTVTRRYSKNENLPEIEPKNAQISLTPYSLDKTVSSTSSLLPLNPSKTKFLEGGVGETKRKPKKSKPTEATEPKSREQIALEKLRDKFDLSGIEALPGELAAAVMDFILMRQLKGGGHQLKTQFGITGIVNVSNQMLEQLTLPAAVAGVRFATEREYQGLKLDYALEAQKIDSKRFNLAEWYKVSPAPLSEREEAVLCEIRHKVDALGKDKGANLTFEQKKDRFSRFLTALKQTSFARKSVWDIRDGFKQLYAEIQQKANKNI